MSKFENIDLSIALERPPPKIQFLVLETYVTEIKKEIMVLAKEIGISEFVSTEVFPAEIRRNPAEWFEFIVTVNWQDLFSAMSTISAVISIGTFIYKTTKFLKTRRNKKQIRKLRIDCTASVALAIKDLNQISGGLKANQIRLVHLSRVLAYHCVAVFVTPIVKPKRMLIITTSIEGRITSFDSVSL